MRFISKKEILAAELALVQGVVEKRNTRPILANALLELRDDILSIYATDLEAGLATHFAIDSSGQGAITAPAKKLADIIKALPENSDVTIETIDNCYLRISCGKIEYELAGAAKEDFPSVPVADYGLGIEIPAAILKSMILQTIYAITTEENRYALSGALLTIGDGKIRMVSTDAHRLAFVEYDHAGYEGPAVDVLIPRKTLGELKNLIDERLDSVVLAYTENHLFFKVGRRTLDSRTLEGQFPNYQKVIPKDNNRVFVLNRKGIIEVINRIALLSNETSRGIRMTFSEGSLLVTSSNPEMGKARQEVDIEYDGPEINVGFNARYLLDFISTVSSDEVMLLLSDEAGAGLMKPTGNEQGNYCYVIMPMRT